MEENDNEYGIAVRGDDNAMMGDSARRPDGGSNIYEHGRVLGLDCRCCSGLKQIP